MGMGMIAGASGAIIGTPAEVALIRMTADGRLPLAERRNYSGVFNALLRMTREEGTVDASSFPWTCLMCDQIVVSRYCNIMAWLYTDNGPCNGSKYGPIGNVFTGQATIGAIGGNEGRH